MSVQTKRTLYRLLALFLAAGGGDAIVQFAIGSTYDWRHLIGVLVAAAVLAGEKYLTEGNDSLASPTVKAVNAALRTPATITAMPVGSSITSAGPPRTVAPPSAAPTE